MSTSDKRTWLKLALIPLGIWTASVVPAEITFRLLGRQPADTIEGYYAAFGDRGGFKNKPEANIPVNWWSGPFVVRTDAQGLRIPDAHTPEQHAVKPDERAWWVLGDSQGFGNGVPYGESVVGRLAARAAEAGVTVRNLSVGGNGLPNQLELLDWYAAQVPAKPERIILLLTPRMVAESGEYNAVVVKDGELFLRPPTVSTEVRRYLRAFSAAYLTVRDALRTLQKPPAQSLGASLPFYDPTTMNEEVYAAFDERLHELKAWTESRGVALSIGYLPFAVGVQIDHGIVPGEDGLDIELPWRFVERATTGIGADVATIRPAMDARVEAGEALSLRGDAHYNPEMSAAAASLLYEALVAPNLNPAPEGHEESTP